MTPALKAKVDCPTLRQFVYGPCTQSEDMNNKVEGKVDEGDVVCRYRVKERC
jgi:hypothetical protein